MPVQMSVFVNGYPAGVDHTVDLSNSADAARTMNNTVATFGAFRTGTVTPPQPPSALDANTGSEQLIDPTWVDNSSDENGFEVERSMDGSSGSLVATLAAYETPHADTGFAASTLYYYRARALGGGGSFAWSNVASNQTLASPPSPISS